MYLKKNVVVNLILNVKEMMWKPIDSSVSVIMCAHQFKQIQFTKIAE